MATEIIVFQPPEQKEVNLTKSERELLYEEFERHSPLESHHFKAFYDMETEDINSSPIKSTISSVMFKHITEINIEPVVLELPKLNMRVKKHLISKEKTQAMIEGLNISQTDEYFFTTQFLSPIRGRLKNGVAIILAPGLSYQVIGVRVPKKIRIAYDKTIPNFARSINILRLADMGSYGLKEFQSATYTQQRQYYPTHTCDTQLKHSLIGKTIIFESNEHALNCTKRLSDLIASMKDYYETNTRTLYTSLQYDAFAKYRTGMIAKAIRPTYPAFDIIMKQLALYDTAEIRKMRELCVRKLPGQSFRFLYALHNDGTLDTYNKICMLGLGHAKSQDILGRLMDINAHRDFALAQVKKKADAYLEFAKKQTIASEKFGVSDVSELSAEQRHIVNLQYQSLHKAQVLSHSLKLAKRLHSSIESMNIEEMRTCVSEVSSDQSEEMIRDATGMPFLCPHVLMKARQTIDVSAFIRSDPGKLTQIRDAIINTYAMPEIDDGYYCRICGALLAEQDEENIVRFLPNFIVIPDIRQALIWKEVAYIVTTFVKFKDPVNVKKIITSITGSIQGEIGFIDSKLAKIRTNSSDNTKDMLRIYVTVYTYAVLIQMIYLNYGKITFVTRRGGRRRYKGGSKRKRVASPKNEHGSDADDESPFVQRRTRYAGQDKSDDKKRLQNIFKTALDLIIRSKNTLLNNLSNMSIDSIKPILIKAYQWVSSLKQSVNSSDATRDANTAYFLSIDPIFEYIWYAHSLKHFADFNKAKPLERSDVKRYLGRSLSQIEADYESNKTIYDTAVAVDIWGKTPKAQYDHGSFMFVYNYVKNKIYNSNVVPMSETASNHTTAYKFLKPLEETLKQHIILQNIGPLMTYDVNHIFKNDDFSNINVSEYYCADGERHSFDIFVFAKALDSGVLGSERIDLKRKEISKWVDDLSAKSLMEFKTLHLVDEKCSKCGSTLSEIKRDPNIIKKLAQISEYRAFYDYFEDRCPEGNLHDYRIIAKKNIENCVKCAFHRSMLSHLDQTYYKKYSAKYQEIVADQKTINANSIKDFKIMSRTYELDSNVYPEWQISNASALQLSRVTQVKYNMLINLGLSEGRKYENIEKEKENPNINSTDSDDILRVQYLRDYCLWVVRTYYTFKNYTEAVSVPAALKEIIDAQRNTNKDLTGLKKTLPDLYGNFNELYAYYFQVLNKKTLANFLLSYLCDFMNKILDSSNNTPYADVGKSFVQYLLKSIIQSEKDVSQPPPLSLIIDRGESGVPQSEELAAEEYIDVSELDEDIDKSLDELEDVEVDDFDRGEIDMGDDYDSDQLDLNAADI